MLIFLLAAAMTVAMLVATMFGLHQEAESIKHDPKQFDHFGFRH